MRRFERAGAAEQVIEQRRRLERLFRHAADTTDFWRSRLAAVDRLEQLPPVGKDELEKGFPDRVVSRTAHPPDLRLAATRGTTQRMICVHDFAKRDAIRAAMVRTLEVAGFRIGRRMVEIPPDVCDVVCGDLGEKDESVWRHLAQTLRDRKLRDPNSLRDLRGLIERRWVYNRVNYPPFGAGGSNPGPERLGMYTDRMRRDRPYLVKGLTTYLHQIAKHALATGAAPLGVAIVKPLGSGATPTMRRTIETGLGGRYIDDYGSAELGPIAAGCGDSVGCHVFTDLFVVEVLDADGRPCAEGELGEVVVTDLINYAMPLIRYRIGDLGRLLHEPCPCGRPAPRLQLEGRVHDALVGADGTRVSSFAIAERLHRLPFVDEFQIVERPDSSLVLTLTPTPNASPDEAAARDAIAEELGPGRVVSVKTARTLPPEPGGKFRWVKPTRLTAPASLSPG
ncbi:hypothetical protein [Botrimarina sp.]|uniref:phenylacetate--CoA ligase family protein n=1 Tax=Botrimarina sp. TaxID=2795802 RepID=UPI0032EDDF36